MELAKRFECERGLIEALGLYFSMGLVMSDGLELEMGYKRWASIRVFTVIFD